MYTYTHATAPPTAKEGLVNVSTKLTLQEKKVFRNVLQKLLSIFKFKTK